MPRQSKPLREYRIQRIREVANWMQPMRRRVLAVPIESDAGEFLTISDKEIAAVRQDDETYAGDFSAGSEE